MELKEEINKSVITDRYLNTPFLVIIEQLNSKDIEDLYNAINQTNSPNITRIFHPQQQNVCFFQEYIG